MRRKVCAAVAAASVGILGVVVAVVVQPPASAQGRQVRQVAVLKASNPGAWDHFGEGGALDGHSGTALAISGDGGTLAAGAPHEASSATGINGNQHNDDTYNAGAVYVFTRTGDRWAQQAYVKASNTGSGDHFGHAVALSADGSTMAVSAYWEASSATGINGNQADNAIPQAGAVYMFTRSGATWTQQAYIKASNTGRAGVAGDGDGDQFGNSLALSDDGNTLAVGALTEDGAGAGVNGDDEDDSANSAGAVYVYTRTGTTWAQQAYIKSDSEPAAKAGDLFGYSLGLSANGNTLAIGVYDEGGSARTVDGAIDNERGGSGAAYVYTRAGTTWTREGYLKTWNAEGGDSWGVSISLSDDGHTLALASLDSDCLCTGVVHAPSEAGANDREANISTGAVAVFVRTGTRWSQQAYVKASNTGVEDWFGARLSLSGDGNTLAVGAGNEDSASRGVNGRQDDESATEAGAVYLFTRSGSMWTQQAYIKAENAEAYDEFGVTVALTRDGRTMVAGARGEDSASAASPADNSIDEAGATYVFAID